MQQNSRFRLSDDRDETINDIISECTKLTQRQLTWLGVQGYPQGTVQKTEIRPSKQMVYAKPSICPAEWDKKSNAILAYKQIT